MPLNLESDTISSLGRAGHDVGLGALIGGNLFARVAMHPALAEIGDKRERGRVLNRSWQRYGIVNLLALGAVVGGWGAARAGESRPALLSGRERRLAVAKDAAVAAVAVTGIASAVEGIRFSRTAPDGAVPMESGDHAAQDAPARAQTLKPRVSALGSAHLASALALAAVNAALGQANFRRPPARRLLKRRYQGTATSHAGAGPSPCSPAGAVRVGTVDVETRHHVVEHGPRDGRPMLFARGFGCDQSMWRYVWPAFAEDHRVVLFDHVGFGESDLSAWNPDRYASLEGYAEDVLEICAGLDLDDVVFVGHSVSAMIGILAAAAEPDRFGRLVLVGPSPRYIDDAGYVGGFTREDIDGLLQSLDSNFLGWSSAMAPVIMGNEHRPELAEELTNSFCRTDPEIAAHFARVTFLSDNREDLSRVAAPCLVLQCAQDAIAPEAVGRYVHGHLPDSRYVALGATGHCPNLSAPEETARAIRAFLVD